ncbi:hypothetical protein MD484_g1308, partial [Candolleomyces efflorescens]
MASSTLDKYDPNYNSDEDDRIIWTTKERKAFAKWQKKSNDLILFSKERCGVFRCKWPLGVKPEDLLQWLRDRGLVWVCFCSVAHRSSPITWFSLAPRRPPRPWALKVYCGQIPSECGFELDLHDIYKKTQLFYDYSQLLPPGLTERAYRLTCAQIEELPAEDEEEDEDRTEGNVAGPSVESKDRDVAKPEGAGSGGPGDNGEEAEEEEEIVCCPPTSKDYKSFKIPILEGWIGDYRGTPTMEQRETRWSDRKFRRLRDPFDSD